MRFLTGLLNEDIDLKNFGCGRKHTFQEFLTVSGIDFAHHAVRGFAKTGHFFVSSEKLTDDEKRQLVDDLSSLKELIALVTPEMQKASNPLELMGFMKQVLKIKNTAEKFKEKNIDL